MDYKSLDLVSTPVCTALATGPPVSSRLRPNANGVSAFQREAQLSSYSNAPQPQAFRSDWDVVRENHRFIREDEEPETVSWEERLARAYESKLFKEFALIDLKHYKSKKLALRWRTAPEVVNGLGEDTCGSLRCRYHQPVVPPSPKHRLVSFPRSSQHYHSESDSEGDWLAQKMPSLQSFELPFVYMEAGERKEALVKVKLCRKCTGKLLWKPDENSRSHSRHRDETKAERNKSRHKDKKHRSRRERRDSRQSRSKSPDRQRR
ncbi:hypothetical protein L204_100675 [Cryptococcus depauperatus]|nr:hypothetical protein L204_01395 [Cryptococcus depauperatus CBS 7855]